jgi:hypothetical protein
LFTVTFSDAFIAATPAQQPDYPGKMVEPELNRRPGEDGI